MPHSSLRQDLTNRRILPGLYAVWVLKRIFVLPSGYRAMILFTAFIASGEKTYIAHFLNSL